MHKNEDGFGDIGNDIWMGCKNYVKIQNTNKIWNYEILSIFQISI